MNTNYHVQHNQARIARQVLSYEQEMQTNLVFELARVAREVLSYEQEMDLEVWESPGLLERGQIKDQFQDGSASFALCGCRPKLHNDRGSDDPNDGSSIPVVLVEKSAEGTRTFDRSVFGSGVAIRFKESCDQRITSHVCYTMNVWS
jgi:hypothetical protein